jgi:hypothetical protein
MVGTSNNIIKSQYAQEIFSFSSKYLYNTRINPSLSKEDKGTVFTREGYFPMRQSALKNSLIIAAQFMLGGLIYCGIEVAYRGYTHRSMLAAGGLCFVLLCFLARSQISLLYGAVIGAIGITLVELAVGSVVNLWLGLEVWDYSMLPFNLWGQVSLPYTLIWFVLSVLVILLARIIRGAVLIYLEQREKERISYE